MAIVLTTMSQIESFKTDSYKEYSDGTRTEYLTLDTRISKNAVEFVKAEVLKNSLVSNFSFYDKADFSKVMFSSESGYTAENLIIAINAALEICEAEQPDVNELDERGRYTATFQLKGVDNDTQVKNVYDLIKRLGEYSEINIDQDMICVIKSYQPVNLVEIQAVLNGVGVEIVKMSNK